MLFAAQEEWGLRAQNVQVPEMPHKRGSHMSAAVGDSVFVMGGWDSDEYLGHLDVYDARAGRWRGAPPMATPRAYGSVAVLDDQIYLIGGLAGPVSVRSPLTQQAAHRPFTSRVQCMAVCRAAPGLRVISAAIFWAVKQASSPGSFLMLRALSCLWLALQADLPHGPCCAPLGSCNGPGC